MPSLSGIALGSSLAATAITTEDEITHRDPPGHWSLVPQEFWSAKPEPSQQGRVPPSMETHFLSSHCGTDFLPLTSFKESPWMREEKHPQKVTSESGQYRTGLVNLVIHTSLEIRDHGQSSRSRTEMVWGKTPARRWSQVSTCMKDLGLKGGGV